MSSRITMVLAVLFLLGAIIAGYLGIIVSRQPEAPPPEAAPASTPEAVASTVQARAPTPVPVEDAMRQSVVVLARDIPAYTPVTAEDLTVERLKVAPVGSFNSIDQVVGRTGWRTLKAGTWLNEDSFDAGGTLARMIRPQERALALSVDEVIGAAGQLSPGDYVDVLLYLPNDADNLHRSSQVAVPALRVLSVGELLGPDRDGNPVNAVSADERIKQEERRATARTVVVAVPQTLLGRLMLATQSGVLRLAVRSASEGNLQDYWTSDSTRNAVAERLDSANRQMVSFSQLSLTPAVAPTQVGASRGTRPVEVIRGNQTTQQTP
ncbi:Flp pilus assembly protein CpaB [Pseudomonas floridensis]|uniref:Flp pilus assembly protein CpaB n=1 Tax=Pseudomonas floridensis TaxID=1958950 RepID=A0A1X0N4S4_9PSED|nr:Flp pilus assembly protein CpaB [Pseudomonas floridensis]ORC58262.1 Flp pilus assembly protein CpaB [Pseudomonas floridensis]